MNLTHLKKINILTPCFNEAENVEALWEAIKKVRDSLPQYEIDHLYIDNGSTDGTRDLLRNIAAKDPKVRVILNSRNFGHIRSPVYGLMQCHGDAAVILASDFQDPPELIPEFLKKWEEGYKVAVGVQVRPVYDRHSIY